MSTFNEIEMTTPYGDTDNVLELNIDASSDAYVLQNVIKLPSTYTFSIWYRTEIDSQITFNVLGESEIVDSTTTWNKFAKTVTVETLDEINIYIIPSVGVNSYFYEGYLVEGITDTSWLPAPEDIEGEIGSVRSELIQTANSILARVSASDGRITTLETNLNGITGRVEGIEGNYTELKQTADNITAFIGDENLGKSTTLKATIDEIETLINDKEEGLSSSIKQSSNGWQALFAELGMYDYPNVITNIKMSINGLEITNPKTKQKTLITTDKFSGYYEDKEIFTLQEDNVVAKQVIVEKGVDTRMIKMIPMDFTVDGQTFGMLSFVKS